MPASYEFKPPMRRGQEAQRRRFCLLRKSQILQTLGVVTRRRFSQTARLKPLDGYTGRVLQLPSMVIAVRWGEAGTIDIASFACLPVELNLLLKKRPQILSGF